MTAVDIFKEGKVIKGNKFDFNEVGDKIQGTYVANEQIDSRYKAGDKVWVYTIKTPEQEYRTIFGKASIDRAMKMIKLGQIIGFELTKIVPSKKGGNDFKDVVVIADSKIVDEEWLQQQEIEHAEPVEIQAGADPISAAMDEMAKDVPKKANDSDLLLEIGKLAEEKLGVKDPAKVPEECMAVLNIAWISSNFEDILKKLKELK